MTQCRHNYNVSNNLFTMYLQPPKLPPRTYNPLTGSIIMSLYSPCTKCGNKAKQALCWNCWKEEQKANKVTRQSVRDAITLKFAEIFAITKTHWVDDKYIEHLEAYPRNMYAETGKLIELLATLQDYLTDLQNGTVDDDV